MSAPHLYRVQWINWTRWALRVEAASEEEAIAKARKLFESECDTDRFTLVADGDFDEVTAERVTPR